MEDDRELEERNSDSDEEDGNELQSSVEKKDFGMRILTEGNTEEGILEVHTSSELFLTRRLSGMPMMYNNSNVQKVLFSEDACKEFNVLLDRFPKPPEDSEPTHYSTVIAGSNSGSNNSNISRPLNAWGSLKGFAEKFYSFGKN